MQKLSSKDYSNAYCLGTQLLRYTSNIANGYEVAELSLKRVETILKALDFSDTAYYIDLIIRNAEKKTRYAEVREVAIHLGMTLSTNKTFEIGTLCVFGWYLPFFKLALESGKDVRTLNIARKELNEHFILIKKMIPSQIAELISNFIKESEKIIPRTEKAVIMANNLDEIWKDLERILDSKDIKVSTMLNPQNVFVVHGHDEAILDKVSFFLKKIELEPIILRDQPSQGLSVIEKLENEAKNAGFCISILSPDDIGGNSVNDCEMQTRARQNVIFELGYFTALLGRERTCVLYKESVEIPSDYHGVIYIKYDSEGAWKTSLARELIVAGMNVNIERLF